MPIYARGLGLIEKKAIRGGSFNIFQGQIFLFALYSTKYLKLFAKNYQVTTYDFLEKFQLRNEQNTMQKKKKILILKFLKFKIRQIFYTYFHQIESVEFIYDSHGQTFLPTLYILYIDQTLFRLTKHCFDTNAITLHGKKNCDRSFDLNRKKLQVKVY